MNRLKLVLFVSTAALLLGAPGASAGGLKLSVGINLTAPQMRLPPPTVAVGHALSPYAVCGRLAARHFKVRAMYRRGPAYAVKAIGPSGNNVEMMVDGRSGTILGLTVISVAPGVVIARAPTTVFVDDRTPFGAVVPEVVYDSWTSIQEEQWEEPAPVEIPVEETYVPYRAAVPYNFVHYSPRLGRSFAVAPSNYRGYQLESYSGRPIAVRESRAEIANEDAYIRSERANDSDFNRVNNVENTTVNTSVNNNVNNTVNNTVNNSENNTVNNTENNTQNDTENNTANNTTNNDEMDSIAERQNENAQDAEKADSEEQAKLASSGTANQDVTDDPNAGGDENAETAPDATDGGSAGGAVDNNSPDAGGGAPGPDQDVAPAGQNEPAAQPEQNDEPAAAPEQNEQPAAEPDQSEPTAPEQPADNGQDNNGSGGDNSGGDSGGNGN